MKKSLLCWTNWAVKNGKQVGLFSDSICNRMSKFDLNELITNHTVIKKAFPGATSNDLSSHYMIPTLENNTPDTAIIHVGINDLLAQSVDGGLSSNSIDEIANNIIKCGQVCKSFGVNDICISSVLPKRGYKAQLSVKHINDRLLSLCERNSFDFLLNDNIIFDATKEANTLFYNDGLHLNSAGRKVLIENFKCYLDRI